MKAGDVMNNADTMKMLDTYLKYNPNHIGEKKPLLVIWAEGDEYKDWYLYLCNTITPPVTKEDEEEADKMLGTTFIDINKEDPEFTVLLYDDKNVPEEVKKIIFYHEITHVFDYPAEVSKKVESYNMNDLTEREENIVEGLWFWTEFLAEYKSYDTLLKELGSLFIMQDEETAIHRIKTSGIPESCAVLCLLEMKKKTVLNTIDVEELACAFCEKGYYFPEVLNMVYRCSEMMKKYSSCPQNVTEEDIEWLGRELSKMEQSWT